MHAEVWITQLFDYHYQSSGGEDNEHIHTYIHTYVSTYLVISVKWFNSAYFPMYSFMLQTIKAYWKK